MSELLRERIDRLEIENDELRERVAELEEILFATDWHCPIEFRLTGSEAAILAAMLRRERCSKEFLHMATARPGEEKDTELKIIDVWICKMRKKLEPFGIEIVTLWGQGYCLTPASKERLNNWAAAA